MTQTTQEILEHYQIRKSKKQKTAFIDWLTPVVACCGYEMKIEKGSCTRNIVIGDVYRAEVVFTAHYDTCAKLPVPNFITPKCIPVYILYQMLLTVLIVLAAFASSIVLGTVLGLIHDVGVYIGVYVGYFGVLLMLFFGPANRHTVNDNTSGVTAVLELMEKLPEQYREKAAFVLFDLEEAGLLGSSAFAKVHKKAMANKLLVNFDCVSDGETILFCFRKKAKQDVALFQNCFPATGSVTSDFVTKGYIYPSDQANFPRGVGVAAMNKTKGGMLYMDKIHTPKDTVYREENIAYLVDGCIRLTEQL